METLGKKYSYGLHLIRSLLTYVTQQWPSCRIFCPRHALAMICATAKKPASRRTPAKFKMPNNKSFG